MPGLALITSLITIISILLPLTVNAQTDQANPEFDLRKSTLSNETAYIPSQCYTKTQDQDNRVYNPCYVCHTRSIEPNYINDDDLQTEYSIPGLGLVNPWYNLLEDRQDRIQTISDQEIRKYVAHDNYLSERGEIILAETLTNLPSHWDYNGNGQWDGYTPDCYFNFDQEGFDRNPNGKETGWRVFAYYPFPGTFWPTNGSTDDILIRLAVSLRQDNNGLFNREIYRVNLAIVEAIVKKTDVALAFTVDENKYGIDLNKDGKIAAAKKIIFDWAPKEGRNMSYVGKAKDELENGRLHLAAGLFPEGTEFLHSVRYIGLDSNDKITLANRMKELRYMKKRNWQTYADLEEAALAEMKERDDFPDRISQIIGNAEQGLNNGTGWLLQGFIEDRNGELRPQNFEETIFCIGCHGGVGITTDSVYGFPRKLAANHYQQGWYHWSQKDISGLSEPKIEIRGSGVYYEYSYYLMYNKSGNEFRDNQEVVAKFYNPDGTIREDMLNELHDDISLLLNPTPLRALALNKAYRTIVEDQDFIKGRDANIAPVVTVYERVEQNLPTGVQQATNTDRFGGHFGPFCETEQGVNSVIAPAITGKGMAGPIGIPYEAGWQGIIHKSRYAIDIPGVHFTFPSRLTLPTRLIIPIGKNPACYTCHRIGYPTVPGSDQGKELFDLNQKTGEKRNQTGIQQLTTDMGQDQNPVWNSDGTKIAFVSNRSGSSQIWLMDHDGANKRQLSNGETIHSWPQWSPDGKNIVVWSYNPTDSHHAVKLINVADGKEKTLVQGPQMLDRPTFHPDGSVIAYAAQTGGNWDIWLVKVDSGKTIRLTSEPVMESNPLWTSDGQVLSYKIAPTTGAYNLTGQNFMTFENGYERPTLHEWDGPESVQMNHWSSDSSKIAYTAEVISNGSGLERVSYAAVVSDLHLQNGRAVASNNRLLAKNCTLGDRGPVFSPDGRMVAFWGWNKDNTASIWLYDLQKDTARSITNGGIDMYPQWSPDGKTLIYESDNQGQMDLMSISVPTL